MVSYAVSCSVSVFLLAGTAFGESAAPAVKMTAPSALRGENVYMRVCAACHGDKGDAKSPAARYLNPLPRDFTSGMFKFRSTPSGELPTDADLLRVVENGIPGSQMPAWKGLLTAQERIDVVSYLKGFAEDFAAGAPPALALPSAVEPTEASIREGKNVYMLMECWACHGGKGKGDGQSAKTLKDDLGNKIPPWNLTRHSYKAGNDPVSLFRTFTTGLNGTPMPAYAADGFLIGGDAKVDPAKYKEAYDEAEVADLKRWLVTQPVESDLQKMPEAQKTVLAEKRKWALVHYIRTLIQKPNFFVRMFTENTEETP